MFQNKARINLAFVIPYKIIIFALLNQNAIQTYPTILGILYLYIQLNLTASSSVAETPDGLHFEPSNS